MLGEASSIDNDVETLIQESEEDSLDLPQSHDDVAFNNTVLDEKDIDPLDTNATYTDIEKLADDDDSEHANELDIKENEFEQSNSFNDSLMQNENIENTLHVLREETNITDKSTEISLESDVSTITSDESFTTTITIPKHVKQLDSLLDNEGIEG